MELNELKIHERGPNVRENFPEFVVGSRLKMFLSGHAGAQLVNIAAI